MSHTLRVAGAVGTLLGLLCLTGWLQTQHRPDRVRAVDPPTLRQVALRLQAQPIPESVSLAVPGRRHLDLAWVRRTAARTGIPEPALTAYARSELMARRQLPDCRIGWPTLAGLGWVESQHGTIGGRSLLADGLSSTPILGPVLDGSNGFAAVPATPESTRLDGDRQWAHAVGPLQFLSSTWGTWGSDGDHDGTADPNNLFDAAWSATRYLCAAGDLRAGHTWAQAVFSYNHSADYVWSVYRAATVYAARAS